MHPAPCSNAMEGKMRRAVMPLGAEEIAVQGSMWKPLLRRAVGVQRSH